MAEGALVWDRLAERFFETGVDRGVLYHQQDGNYNDGEVWNGLTNVTESPSGAEPNKQYADNMVYFNMMSAEEFAATVECFTTPRGFLRYNGVVKAAGGVQISMQNRPVFGFSWRTKKGNALNPDLGYVLHLAYGLQSSPSEKSNNTVSDSPEATTMSYSLSSTPVEVPGHNPTAVLHIDSTDPDVDPSKLEALESILYGAPGVAPRLPLPEEIISIMGNGVVDVTPVQPSYDDETSTITIPTTTGVVYHIDNVVQEPGAQVVIEADTVVKASPAAGYRFTGVFVTSWLFEV